MIVKLQNSACNSSCLAVFVLVHAVCMCADMCPVVTQFNKPEYARKPIVQDTFYRRTTAFAPQGGVAVAATG